MIHTRQSTILVIDDEAAIRQSVTNYLEDLDYRIFTAENGRTGLTLFHKKKTDLVMVNLRMPEMDGFKVLSHIYSTSPNTPLIVVSGARMIDDAVETVHQGAWDFLMKPLKDFSKLAYSIENGLAKARLKKQLLSEEIQKETDGADSLRKYVTICASCKNIRDKDGSWNSIEAYLFKK